MSIEILAPVGNKDTLVAAVSAGADAIYFGGEHFNARRNADNFDDDQLEKAISYCRLNGVKSYLALNILIKNNEFDEAFELVKKAYLAGVDGIIIQDLGLANFLKKAFPKLVLHASTQMSVHSAAALPVLKKMGFSRVVAAREMSRDELTLFCKEAKNIGIETEVFVHGALCMSLSGQCYFSAFLGGRSANRGLCAGTCRLPFNVKGGTGYDLSLKDLSLINHIADLKEMGVTSLKIEGRMKRPEYVAEAVNCVSQAVKNGYVKENDLKILGNVFSRDGFTDGYFKSKLGKNMFGVRTEQDKQLSSDVLNSVHELYRRPKQRIPIDFSVNICAGKEAKLTAECEGHLVCVVGDIPSPAINKPLTQQKVKECLLKLGGTPYFANSIKCNLEDGLMLPISAINYLKQKATEELNKKRLQTIRERPLNIPVLKKSSKRIISDFFARFSSIEQAKYFKLKSQKPTYFSLPAEIVAESENVGSLYDENLYAELPRGASNDAQTALVLDKLKEKGIKNVVCSNLSAIHLALSKGFDVMGGFGLNIFNSYSINMAENFGLKSMVLSPELNIAEICQLYANDNTMLLVFCYGRQPLMLTKNCPVKNGNGCKDGNGCEITDRLFEHFPVVCRNGFSEILNSKTTDISDLMSDINANLGYLYFTTESPEEAYEVYQRFSKGGKPVGNFTRSLYKNGVK